MISVFSGFILAPDAVIKSIGFALGIAVLFDALIVCMTHRVGRHDPARRVGLVAAALPRQSAAQMWTSKARSCATNSTTQSNRPGPDPYAYRPDPSRRSPGAAAQPRAAAAPGHYTPAMSEVNCSMRPLPLRFA
jgi:hypothetical protein